MKILFDIINQNNSIFIVETNHNDVLEQIHNSIILS